MNTAASLVQIFDRKLCEILQRIEVDRSNTNEK